VFEITPFQLISNDVISFMNSNYDHWRVISNPLGVLKKEEGPQPSFGLKKSVKSIRNCLKNYRNWLNWLYIYERYSTGSVVDPNRLCSDPDPDPGSHIHSYPDPAPDPNRI